MIRLAEPKDFPSILEMSRTFWKFTQFEEEFEEDHTLIMIQMAYDHGLLAVADDDGVFGFIAAIKAFLLASTKAKAATELAWWVNPQKRGKMTGVKLIRFLESLCIQQDVKYLNMAYMESSMPERVRDLYIHLGYNLEESVFTKVLNGSDNHRRCSSGGSSIFGK